MVKSAPSSNWRVGDPLGQVEKESGRQAATISRSAKVAARAVIARPLKDDETVVLVSNLEYLCRVLICDVGNGRWPELLARPPPDLRNRSQELRSRGRRRIGRKIQYRSQIERVRMKVDERRGTRKINMEASNGASVTAGVPIP